MGGIQQSNTQYCVSKSKKYDNEYGFGLHFRDRPLWQITRGRIDWQV
jgi:hypothetical protein